MTGRALQADQSSLIATRGIGLALVMATFAVDYRFFGGSATFVSFTALELVAWAFGLILMVTDTEARQLAGRGLRAYWPLALWLGWAVAAAFAGGFGVRADSTAQLTKNSLPAFWVFVVLVATLRPGNIDKALAIFFAGSAVDCLLGVGQGALGWGYVITPDVEFYSKLDLSGGYAGHVAMGIFGHPNNFGLFIAPAIALAATLTLFDPKRAARTLASPFLLLAVPALYLSLMKSSWLWVLLGVGATLWPFLRRRWWLVLGLVVSEQWAVVSYAIDHAGENILLQTIRTRALLWDNGWQSIISSPHNFLLGTSPVEIAVRAKQTMGWYFPHAHNGFINQALFFGFPAGVAFIFTWVKLLRQVTNPGAKDPVLALGVLAMSVTLAGILMLENLSNTAMLALMGFMAALAFFATDNGPQVARVPVRSRRILRSPPRAYGRPAGTGV